MKGILLAGGSGTRLMPLTKTISKQLLPIYDKPMVYYPLSTLMLADIKEILIISTKRDIDLYKDLLGDGSDFGVSLEYKIQDKPNGIAESFLLAENFIGSSEVCLILGDNIFYGQNFSSKLKKARDLNSGSIIFGCHVSDPSRFGVIEVDENNRPLSIEEKPRLPKSNYAVTGLYFYDNDVIEIAKGLKPSKRGELEITDVNISYLKEKKLEIILLDRGFTWLDTGTIESLLNASRFVQTIESQQGLKIACLEEIALSKGWIDSNQILSNAEIYGNSGYGHYLRSLVSKS